MENHHKLPLKKVHFQKANLGRSNLYSRNQKKLGLIPLFLTAVVVAGAVFLLLWYLNIFGLQSKINQLLPKSSETQSADTSSQQVALPQITEKPITLKQLSLENSTSETSIRIMNSDNQLCTIEYSANPTIVSTISKLKQGFWVPVKDKCNIPLQAIQITRLDKNELAQATRTYGNNLVQLDSIDPTTVALLFTSGDTKNIPFDVFSSSLVFPVFTDRAYFNNDNVLDTVKANGVEYYLTGRCDGIGVNTCQLWKKDGDNVVLLQKAIASTAKGEANELRNGDSLRFNPSQSRDESLGLVLNNNLTKTSKALTVSLKTFQILP